MREVRRQRERSAGPRLGVGDTRVGLRIEVLADGLRAVFGVAARREVHAGRERGVRTELGVLLMRPDYVVVVHVHVVLVAFFADDILREADVERAGILVAFRVTRSHAGLPRPERIDTAEYGQIDIIIESEIISGVAQEKTFLVLLAPRRHDEAGLPPARRRKKAEGQHQRINRHVLHDQIRRTHDHLLAGNHLGFGHGQIEVRMIGVAGGELSSGYIDRIVLHLLDPGSEQIAFSVLRRHLLDPGFLGLDVVGDRIHLVARRAVQKFGPRGLARHRVHPSVRENLLALHIDLHEVGLQVLVLILHVAFLVNIDELAARIVKYYDREAGLWKKN